MVYFVGYQYTSLKQTIFSDFLRNFMHVCMFEGLTGLTNLPFFNKPA